MTRTIFIQIELCIFLRAVLRFRFIPCIQIKSRVQIIIIKSHRASRRRRPPCSLSDQHFLPCATALTTSQLLHPALFRSFSTVLLQVDFGLPKKKSVFGLPLALRPLGVHPNAVKQSFSPSLLSMSPSQFHLLRRTSQLMSLISANLTSLLFVIPCCHLICSIRLKYWHWKLFIFRSSFLVLFQVSQPGLVKLKS